MRMTSRRLSAEQRAKVFKALADATRVDIVDALAKNGPLCGTELAERLGISLALVSHHWDVLVEAGLIRKKRVGQQRICSLDPGILYEAVGQWRELAPVSVPAAAAPTAAKAKTKTKTIAAKKRD